MAAGGRAVQIPLWPDDLAIAHPDFAIGIYPGHIWAGYAGEHTVERSPWIEISPEAPPTFLLHAMDDPGDDVRHSVTYGMALQQAGVPVEMHLYAEGGHAFGLRPTPHPVSGWPNLVEEWLRSLGMI